MTTLPSGSSPERVSGAPSAPETSAPETSAPETSARVADSHTYRQVAEGFGDDAGRYDRARPGYPAELADRIVAASPGPDLLDVGCGTGISARLFAAAGCRVLGVDPDPRMAALAREGGTGAEVAKFEDWDARGPDVRRGDRGAGLALGGPGRGCGQGGVGAADRRAARGLLERDGTLGQSLKEAFGAVYRRVMPEHPIAAGFWSRPAVDTYAAGRSTCAIAAWASGRRAASASRRSGRVCWGRRSTRQEWLDMVPTLGGHSQFPPPVIAALLDGLGEAVDDAGGGFDMGYTTLAVVAARTPR